MLRSNKLCACIEAGHQCLRPRQVCAPQFDPIALVKHHHVSAFDLLQHQFKYWSLPAPGHAAPPPARLCRLLREGDYINYRYQRR